MDYDYWLRIVQSGGVVEFHDEYLACSRDYPQTKTRSLRGRVFIENFQVSLRRLGFIHASLDLSVLGLFEVREKPLLLVVDTFARTVQDVITKAIQSVTPVFARDVYFTEKQVCRLIWRLANSSLSKVSESRPHLDFRVRIPR